ncbi:MAG: VTT domain-containing protein [Chitinophagaceae bacterium]|nr:VTT domain-containing protein [Oligoflexus sp.]
MLGIFNESNTWTVRTDNQAWLYSDAAAYYQAFVNACRKAEKCILIAGWDFHSDTVLTYRKRRALRAKKLRLRRFLPGLLRKNPDLHIYILTWDYAPFYMLERERLQSLRRGWLQHPRIHFHLDNSHPISASQHQKFVVTDSSIAFAGGLDLTIRRWDDSLHSHKAPLRKDPYGEPYGAFHDYQLGVTGAIVLDFVRLFQDRWRTATGQFLSHLPMTLCDAENPSPTDTAISFDNAKIGFSRTMPAYKEQGEFTEIVTLFKDLIGSAKQRIIIENQYLTAHSIVHALAERLQDEKGPEVIIILPEKAGGWLEMKTMGMLQDLALKRILAADTYKKARIYFPFDAERSRLKLGMTVHSKLMIVDDRFFSVGSANLNNRSMGYDTECQLTIDGTDDEKNRQAITNAAAYVLAHHCEIKPDALRDLIVYEGSTVKALGKLCDPSRSRHLAKFHIQNENDSLQLEDMNWLDMERPSAVEQAMDQWGFVSELAYRKLGVSPRVLILALTVIFAIVLGSVWHYVLHDPRGTQEALKRLIFDPYADPVKARFIMPLMFGLAAIFFIPINLLIIITASVFTTPWAFLEIFLGTLMNVIVGYTLGLTVGRFIFQGFFGKRTQKILDRIGQGQFLTLLFVRIFPIAPSALINLAAGSGRVPFFRFLLATVLGMTPGSIMLVIFQKSIMDIFRDPDVSSIATLSILGIITFIIFRWSRRRFSQYRQKN